MFPVRLFACLGIAALTTPAFCTEYLIVQDPGTSRCSIVEQVPDSGVVVGDGAFGDRSSADAEMQATAACAGNRQQQVAFTAPAQFLIVQDPGTNRCSIVQQENGSGSVVVFGQGAQGDQPSQGSGPVIVGDGVYGNRPAADADMRTIAACRS
jgi:hypothetical protein